jgi:hypothetical protein
MMPVDSNSERGPGDEELREHFSMLRQEDEAKTPPFMAGPKTTLERPPAQPGWRLTAGSVLAATVLAGLLWLRYEFVARPAGRGYRPGAPITSITQWRPPTDFLLNTPGREILRTAPVLSPVGGLRPLPHSFSPPPNHKPKTPRAPTPLSQ